VTVNADRGQIEQAIVNLAANAREAMPDGGRLEIALSGVEIGESDAGFAAGAPAGRYVLLSVKDSGRGIDEAARAHLFEPFFTTKDRGKGTGMGLPTVYGIVAQSGGHIEVDSAPGAGSEFRIYLPRVDAPMPEAAAVGAAPPAEPVAPPSGAATVLLAEDESVIRTLVAAILARDGHAVLEAQNGVEALEVAEAHAGPIDLLLTDVVMPRMGGRELAERLVRLRPETKVLFMSGYPDDELGVEGVLPDHVAFLAKPFTPEGVSRKVRELLGRKDG
jgi:CheY-like chemotaxis protein